jgi:prepilin-type N-terminal cleavage/methylation domain-containing protein
MKISNCKYQIVNYKSGFTLIEVLIAILFVGLAIASLVGANMAFTQANGVGADMTTAEFLSEQIRELTAMLPVSEQPSGTTWTTFGPEEGSVALYDDLDDFDGASGTGSIFSPPIDANKAPLTDFAAFSQKVVVENVNASNFEQAIADRGSNFVRVTVTVSMNSRPIITTSWLRTRY